uniref:Uncharacterized protein n=1 Tax=Aegilops tauschii subsp. strangulata TaxID=200361 RepID=A0A453NUE6_AEGTS
MSLLAQVPASECGKYTTCRRVMISGFYCTMSSGQPLLSRSSLAREEGKDFFLLLVSRFYLPGYLCVFVRI